MQKWKLLSMKKRDDLILTAGPSITKKEISYVTDAVTNGWNDQWNKYITKLETQFSDYIGVKHAISTTSCTGAMHLALKGLGIGEGDEVVVPETTFAHSGGRSGKRHSEHLGHLLTQMQWLQRAYPGATW